MWDRTVAWMERSGIRGFLIISPRRQVRHEINLYILCGIDGFAKVDINLIKDPDSTPLHPAHELINK